MKAETVTLPISLLEEDLTTSELGSIFILMAIPHAPYAVRKLWEMDKTLCKDIQNLNRAGLIRQDGNGNIEIGISVSEDSTQKDV